MRERSGGLDFASAHGVKMNSEIEALMKLIRSKNAEIKTLRDSCRVYESANLILAAYIAILAEKKGGAVVPKRAISEALGKFLVCAESVGDNYVINVRVEDGADMEVIRGAE